MEKRKMPRMKVGLPVSVVQDENSQPVDVLDLNIHGLAFQSEKFILCGTRLEFLLPTNKSRGLKKIPGEVIQCRVNEDTLDGSFRVGVKFIFRSIPSFANKKRNPSSGKIQPDGSKMNAAPLQSNAPDFPIKKVIKDSSTNRAFTLEKKPADLSLKQEILQNTERVFGLVFIRRSRFYFLSSG